MKRAIALLALLFFAGEITTTAQQSNTSAQNSRQKNREINERFVAQISEQIKGKENEPAEKVFKNIQGFKGIPASRFLRTMNLGYSRALGVNCTHCHVEQDFASDDKRPKRAAREMAAMHRMINQQLKSMKNLQTDSEIERSIARHATEAESIQWPETAKSKPSKIR